MTEQENRWNIPNALAMFRLLGSLALVGVTLAGSTRIFAWLLFALLMSDWIDGKLAIWLRQCTTFGARLDSTADTAMYAALFFGVVWLKSDFVAREWIWIAAALASFAITTTAGLIKYHRVPSYHTRAAKTSWLLIGIAAVMMFADGPVWPFRVAMVAVTLTNIEATAMTWILPEWHADVPSLWHAWRMCAHGADGSQDSLNGEGKQAEQQQAS